jgi:capsular polysaccharide biosynthesis protein
VWNRIGEFYDDGQKRDKLYVSRTKWTKQRKLVNEVEIETALHEMGFQVIYPETMDVPEQVRAFRNARVIVGPSGSGLYNCVYCRDKGERAILASAAFVTLNDALINTRTQSTITYLTGEQIDKTVPSMLADWHIDFELVRDFAATL